SWTRFVRCSRSGQGLSSPARRNGLELVAPGAARSPFSSWSSSQSPPRPEIRCSSPHLPCTTAANRVSLLRLGERLYRRGGHAPTSSPQLVGAREWPPLQPRPPRAGLAAESNTEILDSQVAIGLPPILSFLE